MRGWWWLSLVLAGCPRERADSTERGDDDSPADVDTSIWDSADTGSGSGGDTEDTGSVDSDSGGTSTDSDSDTPIDSDSSVDTDPVGDTDVSGDTDVVVDPPVEDDKVVRPDDLMCSTRPVIVEPVYDWIVHPTLDTSYLLDVDPLLWDTHDWVITDADAWTAFETGIGADLPDPDFASELALASLYVSTSTCGVTLDDASIVQMPSGHVMLKASWTDASIGCAIACSTFQTSLVVAAVPRIIDTDTVNEGHTCTYVEGPCSFADDTATK